MRHLDTDRPVAEARTAKPAGFRPDLAWPSMLDPHEDPDTKTPGHPVTPMRTALLLTLSLLFACASSHHAARPADSAAPRPIDPGRYQTFGTGVSEGDSLPVSEVLARPEELSGRPIRVRGEIVGVCQKKGCWVRVGTEESNLLVRFQDYGFFLPIDATGTVVMEGEVSVEEVSVEMRRHLLEDAGKHAEAAAVTEPETAVRFTASGVALAKAR